MYYSKKYKSKYLVEVYKWFLKDQQKIIRDLNKLSSFQKNEEISLCTYLDNSEESSDVHLDFINTIDNFKRTEIEDPKELREEEKILNIQEPKGICENCEEISKHLTRFKKRNLCEECLIRA